MKRKVSKLGQSTLMVSLPIKWVRSVGIQAGDEVEVQTDEKSMVITPFAIKPVQKRTSIDLTDASPFLFKYILPVLHKRGYQEIEVKYKSAEQLNYIQSQMANILIGFEIVSQTRNTCLIKSISLEEASQYDELERRLFLVLLSFSEETLKLLEEKAYARIEDVLVHEDTINRMSNYCERILVLYNVKHQHSTSHYIIVKILEAIGDDIRDFLKYLRQKGASAISKEFITDYKKAKECLREYYTLFHSFDLDKAEEAYQGFIDFEKELKDTFQKTKDDKVSYHYLLSIMSRLRDTIGTTIGLNY